MIRFAVYFLYFLITLGNIAPLASAEEETINTQIQRLKTEKAFDKLYKLGIEWRNKKGETEERDSNLIKSFKYFFACTELQPSNPKALHNCGMVLYNLKKYEGCTLFLKRAAAEDFSPSLRNLDRLEKEQPQAVKNIIKTPNITKEIIKRARVVAPLIFSLYGREFFFDAMSYTSRLLLSHEAGFLASFLVENRSLIIPYWDSVEFYAVLGVSQLFFAWIV